MEWAKFKFNVLFTGCEAEPPVIHGRFIAPKNNMIGSRMLYECELEHFPTAPAEVYCQKNGEWSKPNFQCVICMYMNI